jgi:hypothetical protein
LSYLFGLVVDTFLHILKIQILILIKYKVKKWSINE